MRECMLEEYGRCCCQCKYRLEAHDHPMGSKTGWACIAFAFEEGEPIAYIGDFEHGLCELFRPLPWEIEFRIHATSISADRIATEKIE